VSDDRATRQKYIFKKKEKKRKKKEKQVRFHSSSHAENLQIEVVIAIISSTCVVRYAEDGIHQLNSD